MHVNTIEFLRQFRFFGYAYFDFIVSFLGILLLSPLLSRLFLLLRIKISKKSWMFFTVPLSIIIHLMVGTMTPMTKDFLNVHGHYVVKIVIIGLSILGLMDIKIVKKKKKKE